jgi:hypothetical protein
MGIYSRPSRPTDAIDQRELECLREMFEAGGEAAVPIGMIYCDTHDLDPPPWLLRSATQLLCEAVVGSRRQPRGRAQSPLGRLRQDLIDFLRWSSVLEVRALQTKVLGEVERLRLMQSGFKALLADREKMLEWLGSTWGRAFECAAMMNLGTACFAGPEAMKASYLRVQRNTRTRRDAVRYQVLDFETLGRLGLRNLIERPRGRKMLPLYNLTL